MMMPQIRVWRFDFHKPGGGGGCQRGVRADSGGTGQDVAGPTGRRSARRLRQA